MPALRGGWFVKRDARMSEDTHFIGPHVSAAGGADHAPMAARALQATGFGLFVKNQKQWHASAVTVEQQARFGAALNTAGYTAAQVLPHAGYLINLANPDPAAHARSLGALIDEMKRCQALGLVMLNLHPGSHLRKLTVEAALDRVAASVNRALAETSEVAVVIENTAGQGGCLGVTLAELARLRERVEDSSRIGFCLDTCHAWAAGYDIRTGDGLRRFLDAFEREVGPADRYLRGMHLNDTLNACGSRVDRHAPLGTGALGWEPFRALLRDPRSRSIPLIIETPDESRWAGEVAELLACASRPPDGDAKP
jgi:deoxyribonuclease-4